MEGRCLCEHLAGDRDSIPGSKDSQYQVLTGTVPDERKALRSLVWTELGV